MIVATIGHQDYILENFADAEALMNIINRARAVDSHYTPAAGSYWTDTISARSLTIEMTNRRFFTRDEHELIQAEMREKASNVNEVAS